MRRTVSEDLWERDDALAAIARACDRAVAGGLSALLFEGHGGVGKSALLRAAARSASERGLRPLEAYGSELERGLAFWTARQLFEQPLLGDAAIRERLLAGPARSVPLVFGAPSDEPPADRSSAMSALFWLCVNWCERHPPLLLIVDDLHLCDPASLRFFDHLIRRGRDLPVALIAAQRPGSEQPLELRSLAAHAEVESMTVPPLSERGTALLVQSLTAGRAAPEFAQACHLAGGGVPFFTEQLVASALADRQLLDAAGAKRVATIAPSGVRRMIGFRLGALGEDALRFARALVLLGEDAEMGLISATVGLPLLRAQRARDRLARAGVLSESELSLAHPLLRRAVAEELGAGAAAAAHRRIACALEARGAPAERVALHVQLTDPAGDAWAVDKLLAVAGPALRSGAFESARALLTRALAEPPAAGQLGRVLFELGRAESEQPSAMQSAIAHLATSLRHLADERDLACAASELAITLVLTGRTVESVETLDRVGARLTDEPAQARVHALAIVLRGVANEPRQRYPVAERLLASAPTGCYGHRLLSGALSREALRHGAPASRVGALARASLLPLCRTMASDETAVRQDACCTAILADEFEVAGQALEHELDVARRRGSPFGYGHAIALRSLLWWRQGRAAEAELDAQIALEQAGSSPVAALLAVHTLARVMMQRELPAQAAAMLATYGLDGPLPDLLMSVHLLAARIPVRLACGERDGAASDAGELTRHVARAGAAGAPAFPWRIPLAAVARAEGDRERARRLVAEQLELAEQFGASTLECEGLIALAGLSSAGERVGLLQRAIVRAAAARLRHYEARATVELGAALRRAGRRREARVRLTAGIELAEKLDDTAIRARGLAELETAGARPRRDRFAGRDGLTASELRVARLALQGLGNREIGEELFVTVKTVETHLSRVYAKLDIKSRRELTGKLSDAERPVPSGSAPRM